MSTLAKTTAKAVTAKGNEGPTIVEEFVSKKRKERNPNPRGNFRLFASALSGEGFPVYREGKNVSCNYINPNREGRGGVPRYVADGLGCTVVIVKYNDGREFVRFAAAEDSEFYIGLYAKAADCSPDNVRARALSDYRDSVAKAKG